MQFCTDNGVTSPLAGDSSRWLALSKPSPSSRKGYDVSGSHNKKANHQTSRPLQRPPVERVLSIEAVMDAARVVFQTGPCREQYTDTDREQHTDTDDVALELPA